MTKELKGEKVILRSIRESDIDARLPVGRHDEFVRMCGGERLEKTEYPPREVWEDWYLQYKDREYFWIIEHGGECVGSARLDNVSRKDRFATYAIGIFDPVHYSKGLGTETTRLVLRYAFGELGLHRVALKVLEYNKRAIRCYEKCGFQTEGVLRESAYINGAFYSDIMMSILEDEWKTITKGEGNADA